VTLKKEASSLSSRYDDRFVSASQLNWHSQNKTKRNGDHGLILSGQKPGSDVHLFVRGEKLRSSRSAPFIYCGKPRFQSWEGEAPITIQWTLDVPVPEHLHRMLGL
jgi:Domain of unknown function (DUF3427)